MAYFCFIATLVVLLRASLGSEHEPRCYSRFDYEEKLMEKTVKNDLQMKQIMEMFETTLRTVEAKKAEIDKVNEHLKSLVHNVKKQVTEDVLKEVESVSGSDKQPTVLFNVRDMKNKSPPEGATLKFKTTDQNIGEAYDPDTGIFTAPCDGTYLFSVQICTADDKWGRIKIVVDGNQVQSVTNYNDANSYTTTSGTTVQRLKEGGQVWVIQDYQTGYYSDGTRYGWNQFSGVLIHQ